MTPTLVTAEQLADRRSVSARSVRRWVAAGLPVRGVFFDPNGQPRPLYGLEDTHNHRRKVTP